MNLNIYKEKIEKWMESYFETKDVGDSSILEPIIYSLKIGGKRIRPILMICTYNMYSKNIDKILPFAAAMEMIHTYSLIHDDLPCMDNDDLRRGKPTNHKVYGEAMATLAGDSLLNEAMNVMFSQCLDGEIKKIRAAAIISKSSGIDGMIKGQIIDIRSEGQSIDEAALLDMHKNKTGQLITASIMAGAIVGEASEKDIEILKSFGEKLGLAFQIKDDILDVEGDFKLLGKTQSDGENNKTNFITMYGIHKCKEFCNNLTQECYNLLSNIERDTKEIEYVTKFLLEREY
ncbi:polyprenyl synthetase family protein [Clostridium sp. UBA1056]|uniref:polyprenyl synthetase family protein n=1 Tax=unclassified Clostridium TaxID=2614128 RepID=UPI0032171730